MTGGMLQVELTSAEGPRILSDVSGRMSISMIEGDGELTFTFWIRRQEYQKLAALCEKRGAGLRILKKRGLYWTGLALLKRPVLVCGLLLLAALMFYLPSRVLFIRVEGNANVPARQILYAAEDCGVGFGASRRYVRSEKVKNALLGAIPELQWAGVNTSGCTAIISVRERQASRSEQGPGASIIADRDGFILSADVTRGTALFQTGQTVRKGQTLVSGYTDCGLCIRATGAEGEIFARTRRHLTAVTPANWLAPMDQGEVFKKYSLVFRKKRINLWKDSGICDTTCGRIYKEYPLTLPGGFRLPIALCVEEYTPRKLMPFRLDLEQAEGALTSFAEHYLTDQMVSGSIGQKEESLTEGEEAYLLEGAYDCTEMIGRVVAEQIGETNGKRD